MNFFEEIDLKDICLEKVKTEKILNGHKYVEEYTIDKNTNRKEGLCVTYFDDILISEENYHLGWKHGEQKLYIDGKPYTEIFDKGLLIIDEVRRSHVNKIQPKDLNLFLNQMVSSGSRPILMLSATPIENYSIDEITKLLHR